MIAHQDGMHDVEEIFLLLIHVRVIPILSSRFHVVVCSDLIWLRSRGSICLAVRNFFMVFLVVLIVVLVIVLIIDNVIYIDRIIGFGYVLSGGVILRPPGRYLCSHRHLPIRP